MTTNVELKKQLEAAKTNPGEAQRVVLDMIEQDTNGAVRIVDANNPFVAALDTAIALAVNNLEMNSALNAAQYPSAARSFDDLYRHMADVDYQDRFASPARATINLIFDLNEIKKVAIPVPGLPGVRRVTLPRHTEVAVSGVAFTLHHPVNIDVMPHGGIAIMYDTEKPSPLQSLSSNYVDYRLGQVDTLTVLNVQLPMSQVRMRSSLITLNSMTGLSKSLNFSNQFHYCRAYIPARQGGVNKWQEIRVTHSDQVYDRTVPTVALKVLEREVRVDIPQIYFSDGLINESVRVDVYTTQGRIDEFSLEGFEPSAFKIAWGDKRMQEETQFTAIPASLNLTAALSESIVTGGANGLSFSQQRERVILRSQVTEGLPITNNQLQASLESSGYELVTQIDNITDRQFLATRDLPEPQNRSTISPVGTTVHKLVTEVAAILGNQGITNNSNRVTILPNALFKIDNDILSIVPNAEVARLQGLLRNRPEALTTEVNGSRYFYTPFHYVMDLDANFFDARAYHFTKPKVVSKYFVESNPLVPLDVRIVTQDITYMDNASGYKLRIQVEGDDQFGLLFANQLTAELSYQASDSTATYSISGNLISTVVNDDGLAVDELSEGKPIDNIYIFEFDLLTRFDVDKSDQLLLAPLTTAVNLTHDFIISLSVDQTFATRERMSIRLGQSLKGLWSRANSVGAATTFETWSEDVMRYYDENIFERTENDVLVLKYDVTTEELEYNLLHHQGDPVLNSDGIHEILHRQGDIKLDEEGKPIVKSGTRGIMRYVDLFLMDGRYYFATDASSIEHRIEAENLVVSWVTEDMTRIANRLIERSELFFHPRKTTGQVRLKVNDGEIVSVPAEQSLAVTYHIDSRGFRNPQLKEAIKEATLRGIKTMLSQTNISRSDIISHLALSVGYDVDSIELTGLFEDKYRAGKVLNRSEIPSIAKSLVAESNRTTRVVDNVEVTFVEL